MNLFFQRSASKLTLAVDGKHYDNKHHAFVGPNPDLMFSICQVCEQDDHAQIHTSYEEFSRSMDQTFG